MGKSLYDVLSRKKADWFMAYVGEALAEGRMLTVEYGLAGSDVEGLDTGMGPSGEIWFEGRIQPLPFLIDDQRAVVWTARNITLRHALESQLRQMSETDELTGVYNRRRLLEELEIKFREFRRYAEPTALLMFDIDRFKRVNDRYGHVAGDRALRAIARLCVTHLREVDLLARFGGEKFVVLLPHTDLEQARETAERLRQAVAETTIEHEGDHIRCTISVGVSTLCKSDHMYESVIKRIDGALYEAKRGGRNCVMVAED